jgi:hypothetical protein
MTMRMRGFEGCDAMRSAVSPVAYLSTHICCNFITLQLTRACLYNNCQATYKTSGPLVIGLVTSRAPTFVYRVFLQFSHRSSPARVSQTSPRHSTLRTEPQPEGLYMYGIYRMCVCVCGDGTSISQRAFPAKDTDALSRRRRRVWVWLVACQGCLAGPPSVPTRGARDRAQTRRFVLTVFCSPNLVLAPVPLPRVAVALVEEARFPMSALRAAHITSECTK